MLSASAISLEIPLLSGSNVTRGEDIISEAILEDAFGLINLLLIWINVFICDEASNCLFPF